MRLFAAIGLFFLSLALLFVGVAQRTIWHPPAYHEVALKYDSNNPLAVLPNATLSAFPGKPEVTVAGDANTFLAVGSESDIRAWIGSTSHTDLSAKVVKENLKLTTNSVSGTTDYASPVGSDLWRQSASGASKTTLTVDNNDAAGVMIASDGFAAAPGSVTIRWPIAYSLAPSNLFLTGGAVALLLSFVMNILAIRDHRKKRGPKRKIPKAPQGPRTRRQRSQIAAPVRGRRAARKVMAVVTGLTVVSMLSGCSTVSMKPNVSASPSPTNAAAVVPPALLEGQINRIVQSVSSTVSTADRLKNKVILSARFSGPALEMRSTEYFLQKKSSKVASLPEIAARPIKFSLPAATNQWPRVLMVTTETPGSKLPQMLVMQQDTPRAAYHVNYVIALMSGATIPSVPISSVGAIPASIDSVYLEVPPVQIPATYGDVIDNGSASLSAGLYDVTHDQFYLAMSANQRQQIQKLTKGKIRFRHTLGSPTVLALSTSDGGALVALYMKDSYIIKPTKAGSAVSVSGNEKLMLGAVGSTTGIHSVYGNMMLFYVPPLATNKRVKLLGVTQGLLQVLAL